MRRAQRQVEEHLVSEECEIVATSKHVPDGVRGIAGAANDAQPRWTIPLAELIELLTNNGAIWEEEDSLLSADDRLNGSKLQPSSCQSWLARQS